MGQWQRLRMTGGHNWGQEAKWGGLEAMRGLAKDLAAPRARTAKDLEIGHGRASEKERWAALSVDGKNMCLVSHNATECRLKNHSVD